MPANGVENASFCDPMRLLGTSVRLHHLLYICTAYFLCLHESGNEKQLVLLLYPGFRSGFSRDRAKNTRLGVPIIYCVLLAFPRVNPCSDVSRNVGIRENGLTQTVFTPGDGRSTREKTH